MQEGRTAESFRYQQEISKELGGLDSILTWCHSECEHEWRWRLLESSNIERWRYCFYFDSDKDACAFTLRWS